MQPRPSERVGLSVQHGLHVVGGLLEGGEEVAIESPLPEKLKRILERLRINL